MILDYNHPILHWNFVFSFCNFAFFLTTLIIFDYFAEFSDILTRFWVIVNNRFQKNVN